MAIGNKKLYIAVTGLGDSVSGIYTLPLGESPSPSELELFTQFGAEVGPDEMEFGRDENLYVTGALNNAVYELSDDGELLRVFKYEGFQEPAGIIFEPFRNSVIVLNHALLTDPSLRKFSVFDVFVGESEDEDNGDE